MGAFGGSRFKPRNESVPVIKAHKYAEKYVQNQGRPSTLSQRCILHIFPSVSAKFLNSSYFRSFSFFVFPYFDHDTFPHHAKHVLDAHAKNKWRPQNPKFFLWLCPLTESS